METGGAAAESAPPSVRRVPRLGDNAVGSADWRAASVATSAWRSTHKPAGRQQMTPSDRPYERTKKRCVGSLDGMAVYFVGSRVGFHLAIEYSPGEFHRLSEPDHLRFKRQSRIEGHHYEQ